MSVWETLRKKRLWMAVGVSMGLLLMLWALGAMLIEKGTLPLRMQAGWIAASTLCAGFMGGCIVSEKRSGTLTGALTLTLILIVIELIISWGVFGGINLGDGAWKNMISLFAGSLLAGFLCAGRRGGGKRKGGKRARVRLPRRR